MEELTDADYRRCRCRPCWCCGFNRCTPLRTAAMIVAAIELIWNAIGLTAVSWVLLFYEKIRSRAIANGYATEEDYAWKKFMDAYDNGLQMLCASYLVALIVSFAMLIHADQRKKCFTVWWLLVMPNVTGLQIAAIYFFPFPYTHANSAMAVLRVYFFWIVFAYVGELCRYPDGLPKPKPRAEIEQQAEAGEEGGSGNQIHIDSVRSHQVGDDVAVGSRAEMIHHHETKHSVVDYNHGSTLEKHHEHHKAHQHYINHENHFEHEGHKNHNVNSNMTSEPRNEHYNSTNGMYEPHSLQQQQQQHEHHHHHGNPVHSHSSPVQNDYVNSYGHQKGVQSHNQHHR